MKLTKELIYGFSGSCLVDKFDGSLKTPACHLEWWDLCCSPFKYVAIAAPRRHAKTSAITVTYTLAELLFRILILQLLFQILKPKQQCSLGC